MKKFMSVLFSILLIISYVGAFLMHLYTSWLCNLAFGAFWGIITFLTPPFSDLIMTGIIIQENGIVNPFIIEWAVVLCLYIVPMFILERSNDESLTPKTRYCKRCGSQLGQDRKCPGCGKQYFNCFKNFRTGFKKRLNALSVSCMVIICAMIAVTSAMNTQLIDDREKIASLESDIKNANNQITQMSNEANQINSRKLDLAIEVSRLKSQVENLDKKSKFFDVFTGITTETGTKFHKYGCHAISLYNNINIGSIKMLYALGYDPCKECHTSEEIALFDEIYKDVEMEKSRTVQRVNTQNLQFMRPGL